MPPGVLDGLKPFMDFHSSVDGVDFRQATFILLSNTGGREITRRTMEFWQEGRRRETMSYFDLEGKQYLHQCFSTPLRLPLSGGTTIRIYSLRFTKNGKCQ